MSYVAIVALLKTALLLLSLAQGPNVPQSLHDQAVSVANQAIAAATQALAGGSAIATPSMSTAVSGSGGSSSGNSLTQPNSISATPPQSTSATAPASTPSAVVITSHGLDSFNSAVEDLFGNFWTGARSTGHIIPTSNGYPGGTARGALWEADTMFDVLYTKYKMNPTDVNAQPIRAEWNYITSSFSDAELTACGGATAANWGSDDTGWDASMFLNIYDVTHDTHALAVAKGAVQCGYNRWGDTQLGGGLWYSDALNIKSLYGIGLADDAFRIFQYTGDATYLGYTQFSYAWFESYLKRSDNLYWTDYGWSSSDHSSTAAPIGAERPTYIQLAGSVSFLAGNMAMDILHARMYRLTGDAAYLQRLNNVATSILNTYKDSTGGFLDDRDGWANGHFVYEWIVEVYPLLSPSLQAKAQAMFAVTSNLAITNDRTSNGLYGAAWDGPLISAWSQIGTVPQQIMTSANAVDFISGSALIDSHIAQSILPSMPASPVPFNPVPLAVSANLLGQTGEDFVGTQSGTPDGIKDVHVRLSGVTSPIVNVSVSSPDGLWSYPTSNGDWIVSVRPESDPTIVDLYFDFYKNEPSYSIGLTLSNGKSTIVKTVAAPPINAAASLLGQTGEDIVGQTATGSDGVKDVHVRLTGVSVPLSGVQITTPTDGQWLYPSDGQSWIISIMPETDPTIVDLYFEYYKQFSLYNLALKFTDGRSAQLQAK